MTDVTAHERPGALAGVLACVCEVNPPRVLDTHSSEAITYLL